MPVTGNKSLLNYSLSIRLCTDGFSFLVSSIGSGQSLLQESLRCGSEETMSDALMRGLQLPRISGRHYERVILYSTLPSTRVPLDEFRREDMLALYRLTFSGAQYRPEDMCFQVLPSLEVVEIFPLQAPIVQALKQQYPSALIKGLYGSMLCHIAEMQQGSVLPVSFHAVVLDGGVLIASLRHGKLYYANVFRATGNPNILYFILYVWKALALDAWHDLCILYSADQELYHDACQYLANVELRELDL